MNFSKTTSYSINVLSYLAQHENTRMSASYLHKKLEIPYSYLRAVLSELSKKNLINSLKGRNGGFTLARDKTGIFLAEIIDSTQGLDSFSKCIMGFDKCPFNYGCFMHPLWIRMRSQILDTLWKTSLADLLVTENKI